jgi:predicted dehydrogenase
VAPGHQIGFNDLKAIEVKTLIKAVAGTGKPYPDFREAYEVERVVEAVQRSSAERRRVRIDEV